MEYTDLSIRGDARPPQARVKRQRQSLSCTECTRRKLRCTKRIPCMACIERGIANQCQRRSEPTRKETRRRISSLESVQPPAIQPVTSSNRRSCSPELTAQPSAASHSAPSVLNSVTQDAAVMLEFLALSRRHVLQVAQVDRFQRAETISNAYELLFTVAQVRNLMSYHQECIAWIHNVVHMPTFREQCEDRLSTRARSIEADWLSLYYAMLAITLYHADCSKLQEYEVYSGDELALACYQKSIASLNQADFMKNHSLFSVQAICLLIYIGHNIGESDRISVLLSSGTRIAQCLAIHRLGPDSRTSIPNCTDPHLRTRRLIDHSFQQYLQYHYSQFNTPMPSNCDENTFQMIVDGEVKQHNQDHYTQGSYTSVLNHVAVVIWNMEDRTCQKRTQDETEDSIRGLYSEVLQADRELKQLIAELPAFFRPKAVYAEGTTDNFSQQRAVLFLSFAHKFYSVHRHFQTRSLGDPWFAYTKLSCLPIMRRHLDDFLSLREDDPCAPIVRTLWTVNTQVLTATVWLLFEPIFSEENERLFDPREIRALASRSLSFLQTNKHKSNIAKRGIGLIESLLETELAPEYGKKKHFSLQEIISRVELDDFQLGSSSPRISSSEPWFASTMDPSSGDTIQWEEILSLLS